MKRMLLKAEGKDKWLLICHGRKFSKLLPVLMLKIETINT